MDADRSGAQKSAGKRHKAQEKRNKAPQKYNKVAKGKQKVQLTEMERVKAR